MPRTKKRLQSTLPSGPSTPPVRRIEPDGDIDATSGSMHGLAQLTGLPGRQQPVPARVPTHHTPDVIGVDGQAAGESRVQHHVQRHEPVLMRAIVQDARRRTCADRDEAVGFAIERGEQPAAKQDLLGAGLDHDCQRSDLQHAVADRPGTRLRCPPAVHHDAARSRHRHRSRADHCPLPARAGGSDDVRRCPQPTSACASASARSRPFPPVPSRGVSTSHHPRPTPRLRR